MKGLKNCTEWLLFSNEYWTGLKILSRPICKPWSKKVNNDGAVEHLRQGVIAHPWSWNLHEEWRQARTLEAAINSKYRAILAKVDTLLTTA